MEQFMQFLHQFVPGLLIEHPENLWFAVPGVAIVVAAWLAGWRWRVRSFRQYGNEKLVARFSTSPVARSEWPVVVGMCLAVIFGAIAATLPYLPTAPVSVPSGSLKVVAAFDASISMSAEDYRSQFTSFGGKDCSAVAGPCGTRMDVAKLILAKQIMPAIDGNQLGLSVYAGYGMVKSYLNDDFSPLYTILGDWKWIDVGSAQGNGSYVASGITNALDILDHNRAKDDKTFPPGRIILLFTDGGHDGSADDLAKAVQRLRKENVRLIIIGVGSTKQSPIPVYDASNNLTGYFSGSDKQPLTTARDDAYLQELAAESGGTYLKAIPGQQISINWPSVLAGSKVEVQKDLLYQYPLGLAVFFLGLVFFRRLPARILSLRLGRGRSPQGEARK